LKTVKKLYALPIATTKISGLRSCQKTMSWTGFTQHHLVLQHDSTTMLWLTVWQTAWLLGSGMLGVLDYFKLLNFQ